MDNQSPNQPPESSQQYQNTTEEKKERIDELDLIGIGILRLFRRGFEKIKNIVSKSKNSV